MSGGSSQTSNQTTTTNSSTQPWAQAMPLLTNMISDYQKLNPGVSQEQTAALQNLAGVASNIPQWDADTLYSPFAKSLQFNTSNEQNELQGIPGWLSGQMSQTIDQNNLNPNKTPGFSDAMHTMENDITNQVKSQYAGSGRDPTGAGSFSQSLGRGISQGEAPVIASEFNANRTAQNQGSQAIAGAMGTAATQTAGLRAGDLASNLTGIGYLPQTLQDMILPGQTMMQFANTLYGQPYQNLSQLLGPSLGLGAMGSTMSGTGTSNGTVSQSQSGIGNVLGGISGIAGLFGLSDKNAKEDIEEVGKLHDGQKVYRYRFKGHPKMHIGLLAQEVEEHVPDAVGYGMLHGQKFLAVEHERATDRAAEMGAH